MISPNIKALKAVDNLKWELMSWLNVEGYSKTLQVFNYSGEPTEEYKAMRDLAISYLNKIKIEVEFLVEEAEKLN